MVGLYDDILKIHLFVTTKYINVTDRRADGYHATAQAAVMLKNLCANSLQGLRPNMSILLSTHTLLLLLLLYFVIIISP